MSTASKLGIHKDSHVISNTFKPKIRIIRIFAPEIIKTEVENFRELVQRLTGKPADRKGSIEKTSKAPTKGLISFCPEPSKNVQSKSPVHILYNGDRMKKESEETLRGENSNCFVGGFGDIKGLIQDLTEFPLLPLESSQFNICGGMPLLQ